MDRAQEARRLEVETQLKVSESISKLEVALSEWDNAKPQERSPALEPRINFLRSSYDLLCSWEKESLIGAKDDDSIVKRLQSFSRICRMLEKTRVT